MIGFACVCISEVVKYVRTKEELIMSTTVNKKDLAAKLVAEYDLSKKVAEGCINTVFEEIMNTLARWYDVEVFYVNNDLKNLHFTGHLKRYDQITTILKAIESAVNVKFSVKGRTISVMK